MHRLFFFLIFSFTSFLQSELLFDQKEGDQFLQIESTPLEIQANKPLTLTFHFPKSFKIDASKIALQVASSSHFALSLWNQQEKDTSLTMTWLSNYAGDFEVDLGKIEDFKPQPFKISIQPITLAETHLALAPLLPLKEGDPLELDPILKERLTHASSEEVLNTFHHHTFPLLKVLLVLFVMGMLPLAISLLKKLTPREKFHVPLITKEHILKIIAALEKSPPEKSDQRRKALQELSYAYKVSIDPRASALTTEEFLLKKHEILSDELILFFKDMELLQFQKSPPDMSVFQKALHQAKHHLKS